ncbi:DUF2804 domain-containing protein [Vibrio sp. CAU 1672]|uniref:DUF2804 domain-containing protein n=1 Tax=Vibrio sp. CAU 1672 TaxID=3032594 RepID=UPI0023DB7AA4|nr:DUF2804 domain-containing protein [Vibrio sp. CAU 1672]MDF2153518.1 DUF2804 domain-containing protein [Vibrio sp. CAU 1672]
MDSIVTLNTQHSLIGQDGMPQYGQLKAIPLQLGLPAFQYRNEMDNPASRWRKFFDYKQFQFVSIVTSDYVVGVAIADIRYLVSGFCYVFDKQKEVLSEQQWLRPLNIGAQTQSSSWQSSAQIAKGRVQFVISGGEWRIKLNTSTITADLCLQPLSDSEPLMLCTPTGYAGWTYTQKHNALRVSGSLRINNQPQELSKASAGYDFSAGYMRRETSWRWASINHRTDTVSIGLNLAAGVNETGACENVLWVNGVRHLLPSVSFQFFRLKPDLGWKISSQDGRVNLMFKPRCVRAEKKNFILLKSNFRQYVGHFSGAVIDGDGTRHELEHVLGLTEDHFAKW